MPVLMPTTVCGCHDTPHLAAGRQEHTLHYRGVVERGIRLVRYRVKRAFSLPLVKPSLHVRGTVLLKKQIADDIARGLVPGALLGSAPD